MIIIFITFGIIAVCIWFTLIDIKTELKYKNTLLKNQNTILKESNEIQKIVGNYKNKKDTCIVFEND